jgi:L,D-peptidoglycan transpeptidase YkuD (ErfK/YbiS/YcfS/YnhG family)
MRFPAVAALTCWVLCCLFGAPARAVDPNVRQLIVGIAPDWNTLHGRLQLFRRDARGQWQPDSRAIPVLFGKNGLAWGRGVEGTGQPGLHKQERDGRAPAGVFKIGTIYTYDAALPPGADYPFHQVTTADAWVDDAASPDYNKFVTIPDPAQPPAWFDKMKMRHGDFAYRWLVEIRHNADPPVPGAGSAIFFHIRRGENRPTSGCTTMAEPELKHLVCWLRAADHPEYVLLPWDEYQRKWRPWDLPDPAEVAAKP